MTDPLMMYQETKSTGH